jgi:hypothetical protein
VRREIVSEWPNLQAALIDLLTSNISGWFLSIGTMIMGAIAVMRITWLGYEVVEGKHGDQWRLPLMRICLPFMVASFALTYWMAPWPVFGITTPHFLIDIVSEILKTMHLLTRADVNLKLSEWQKQMETPLFANVRAVLYWAIIQMLLAGLQVVGFIVLLVAYVALAVAIVEGPLYIAFHQAPGIDFMYRGWLRSIIAYGTMPITISLVSIVTSNFVLAALTPIAHNSVEDYVAGFIPIVSVLCAGIVALVASPSIHRHIISGDSGVSGAGIIGVITGRFLR